MRRFILSLLAIFSLLAIGCSTAETGENDKAMTDISFEDFVSLFPQVSDMKEINAENGEDFRGNPEIEPIYLQNFILGKVYLNQSSEKLKFIKNINDNQEIIYRVVGRLSLNTSFYSLLISANLEGDPTHKWAYYLLNYAKGGSYIDGILLSYRKSYLSEESLQEFVQSEYRYVSFLPQNQLYFVDISYDNTLQGGVNYKSDFLLTTSEVSGTQYFRESWYQIEESGAFKQLKVVERNKNDAQP